MLQRGTVNSNLRAWSSSLLRYIDLTVDASGNLNTTGGGGGGGSGDGAILDGTTATIKGTVKASEVAPLATDTALVVTLRQELTPPSVVIQDSGGQNLDISNSASTATDYGVFVRIVPQVPTATKSSVAAAAVDTSLLALNNNRHGATIYNDADKELYLSLGSVAASTSSFTAKLLPGGYYEVPYGFYGAVRGIWATAPTGNARLTEVTN